MTTKFIENVKDISPFKTGTKLIENKVDASPSKTGVKFVKNVEDKRNQIVLYNVPKKKPNIRNWFKKTFTYDSNVWIAKVKFRKKSDDAAAEFFSPYAQMWSFACVKETRNSLWVSNNGGDRVDNPGLLPIDDMVKVTAVPDSYETKTVPESCKKGGICTPPYQTTVKIDGYNIITYDVNLRTKIDVFETDKLIDDYDVQPSYLKFDVLLKIYNKYNTNGVIVEFSSGDKEFFAK